jgi:hypothetical protein
VNESMPSASDAEPASSEEYARAWRSYQLRWRTIVLVSLCLPTLAAAAELALPSAEGRMQPGLLVFLFGLPLWFGAALGLGLWRCPRCRHDYFQTADGWYNPWRLQCAKCGLPKWSLDPSARSIGDDASRHRGK